MLGVLSAVQRPREQPALLWHRGETSPEPARIYEVEDVRENPRPL